MKSLRNSANSNKNLAQILIIKPRYIYWYLWGTEYTPVGCLSSMCNKQTWADKTDVT